MTLTARELYDYRDIDRRELKLIRMGHAIWALYKQENAKKGSTGIESEALLEACETVWELKRQLRAELKAERKAKFEAWSAKRANS